MRAPEVRRGGGVEVLCPCLDRTAKDVCAWAAATQANAEGACNRLGVASACGSCVRSVVDIAGDPGGLPAIVEVAKILAHLAEATLKARPSDGVARAPSQTLSLLLGDEQRATTSSRPWRRSARRVTR